MQTVLNSPAEYNANWEVGNDNEFIIIEFEVRTCPSHSLFFFFAEFPFHSFLVGRMFVLTFNACLIEPLKFL